MVSDDQSQDPVAAMMGSDQASRALGIEVTSYGDGRAVARMRVRADMVNGYSIAHGGLVFTLADTAFASVCNGRNERTVAAQASIVFLDAAKEGEVLIAEGEEVSRVGRSGVTRVTVRTEDGRAIAEFTGYSRTIGGTLVDV